GAEQRGREEEVVRQLLEEKEAARTEHPAHLGERALPVGNVVEDGELEDRVVLRVGGVDVLGIADPEPDGCPGGAFEAGASPLHLFLVEIEGVDGSRPELAPDLAHSLALPAADLEDA